MGLVVGLSLLYCLSGAAAYTPGAHHAEREVRLSLHAAVVASENGTSSDPGYAALFAEEAGEDNEEPVDAEALTTLYLTVRFLAGLWLLSSHRTFSKDSIRLLPRGGRSAFAEPFISPHVPLIQLLGVLQL